MPSLTIKQGVKNAHDLTLNEKAVFQTLIDDYLTGKGDDLNVSKVAKMTGLTTEEVAKALLRLDKLAYVNAGDGAVDWGGIGSLAVDSVCVVVAASQAAMNFASDDPVERREGGYDLVAIQVDGSIVEVYAEVVSLRLSAYEVSVEGDERPSIRYACRDGVTRDLVGRIEDVTSDDWNVAADAWGYFDGWCESNSDPVEEVVVPEAEAPPKAKKS